MVKGKGKGRMRMVSSQQQMRRESFKVPAACPGLTKISLILGLPSGLAASLATGTSLVVAA